MLLQEPSRVKLVVAASDRPPFGLEHDIKAYPKFYDPLYFPVFYPRLFENSNSLCHWPAAVYRYRALPRPLHHYLPHLGRIVLDQEILCVNLDGDGRSTSFPLCYS